MSVSFAKALATEVRKHGVRVVFYPDWDRRGNGQTSGYRGSVTHHTGSDFDAALRVLVEGRRDLRGPLCNSAGWADGHITIVAAHPANHAGASGGYNTAPLPVTRNFNRLMWGHEIMYPGSKPMTDAQYRTAQIVAGAVNKLLGRSKAYAKAHAETSITGKWDPGYAPGKTINMNTFRNGIADAMKGDDMAVGDDILKRLKHEFRDFVRKDSSGKVYFRRSHRQATLYAYDHAHAANDKCDRIIRAVAANSAALKALAEQHSDIAGLPELVHELTEAADKLADLPLATALVLQEEDETEGPQG